VNGHARNDGTEDDQSVVAFPSPERVRRVRPANDNSPPLGRRIFRMVWVITAVASVGWVLWSNWR
jgi:hypothetical protein